ncbi:MAG: DUF4352 domain-containing protein [Candidatus Saccharimonadales bacterium]
MPAKNKLPLADNNVAKALIIMIVLIGAVSLLNLKKPVPPVYPFKTWSMGEVVGDNKLSFSVSNTRHDTIGAPGFWAPRPDQKFLIVGLTFTNKSDQTYQMLPIRYMKLMDSQNQDYEVTSAPTLTQGFGGPVAPHSTMTGQVGFIVSRAATGLKLVFDPHIVDENIIEVALH